jgi:hypothetical protein
MQFLKKLFQPEPPVSVEYKQQEHHTSEDIDINDVKTLSRSQINDKLSMQLGATYKEADKGDELVRRELSQVSEVTEIDSRIQQLEHFLSCATQGIYLGVMEHHQEFGIIYVVQGMENIQLISKDLDDCKKLSQTGFVELNSLKENLTMKAFKILKLKQRQINLFKLNEELNHFAQLCYASSLSIKQAIRSDDLYYALQLCNQASEKLPVAEVQKYRALEHHKKGIEDEKSRIYNLMKEGLCDICKSFNAKKYENILLSYITSESYSNVNIVTFPQEIQTQFQDAVMKLIKQSVSESLNIDVSTKSLDDFVALIPKEKYLYCVKNIFKYLSALLFNHHLICRWHEENE